MRSNRYIFGCVLMMGMARLYAQDAPRDRMQEALRKSQLPRPELSSYSTPALEQALTDPQKLLAFITKPGTTYRERCAGALRGKSIVPPETLPAIMAMRAELKAEQVQHNWGLKFHPMDSRLPFDQGPGPTIEPKIRTVLGHDWSLPATWQEFPITFDEESAAPWPWQVQQALNNLYVWMMPRNANSTFPDVQDRWLKACLALPVETDDQSWEFVEACDNAGWTMVSRPVGVQVLARCRAITMNSSTSRGATNFSMMIPTVARDWREPDASKFAEVLMTDLIKQCPHFDVRMNGAYLLKELMQTAAKRNEVDGMSTTLLADCQAAVDPLVGSEWDRLNAYAYSVAEAVPKPPFVPKRSFDGPHPDSPEAAQLSQAFAKWFAEHQDELTRRADARELKLDPFRQELIAAMKNLNAAPAADIR